MKYLILLWMSLFVHYLQAQEKSIDTRIDILFERANNALSSSGDSAIYYAKQAIQLAQQHNKDDRKERLLNMLASAYLVSGEYDSSRITYLESLEASKGKNKLTTLADAYNGLGGAFFYLKEFDKSIEHYIAGAELYDSLKQEIKLSGAYNNIGMIMSEVAQKEKALFYFKNALQITRSQSLIERQLPSLVNIASLYLKQDQVDSALIYAQEAFDKSETINHLYGKAMALTILSEAHAKKSEFEYALREAQQSKTYMLQFGDSATYNGLSIIEAQALIGLKKYTEADQLLQRLYEEKHSSTLDNPTLYELLHESAKRREDYKAALKYYELATEANRKVFDVEKEKHIALLEKRYETAQKEAQIKDLNQLNRIQKLELQNRNILITIILGALVCFVSMGIVLYQQNQLTQKQRISELKQRLLRIQLNPHFLFNALNAIQNMIYSKQETARTADYLAHFSQLTRKILELNDEDFIPLEEEINFINSYLKVQTIRFDKPFDYQVVAEEDLDIFGYAVPPMITQPFIENAIEHGILTKVGEGSIAVHFKRIEDQLQILISDNGIGRQKAAFLQQSRPHRSMATQITRDRLRLLQLDSTNKVSMEIRDLIEGSLIKGTQVIFNLPLIPLI